MQGNKITLTIDGVHLEALKGEKILWAALDAGIYIPNLCAIRELTHQSASCRLCFVEIEGRPELVTACTEPVQEGMVVYTRTPRVDRIRRTAFEFLISHHRVDCRNCAKNRNCELQRISAYLKLKLKTERVSPIALTNSIDDSHPCFIYDPGKCVLCGKCVWACEEYGAGELQFAFRGINTVVTTFGNLPFVQSDCSSCDHCVSLCPVGALVSKEDILQK